MPVGHHSSSQRLAVAEKVIWPSRCLFATGALTVIGTLFFFFTADGTIKDPGFERYVVYSLLLNLPMGSFIMYAAACFRARRRLVVVHIACFAAAIPLFMSCWFVGAPVAIWSLFVLGRADVQSEFRTWRTRPPFP